MKKYITLLIVAACMLSIPANGQIRFGVKGGVNITDLSLKNIPDNFSASNRTGFILGPTMDIKIPLLGFGLDASVLYSSQKAHISSKDNGSRNISQKGIDIPVNLKYNIGFSKLIGIYFAAGPNFFFDMSKNEKFEGVKFKKENVRVGLNLGGGVTLLSHLQLGVAYNIPFGDSAKDKEHGMSYKSKTWQVSAAYLF